MKGKFDVKYTNKDASGSHVELSRTVRECANLESESDKAKLLERKDSGIKRAGASDGQIMYSYFCTESSKPCNSADKLSNSLFPTIVVVVSSILSSILFW